MSRKVRSSIAVALTASVLAFSPALAQGRSDGQPPSSTRVETPKKAKPQVRRQPKAAPSDDMLTGQGQFRPPSHDELMQDGSGRNDAFQIKPMLRRGGAGVGMPF
ncbi:hypothetical protein ACFQU1_05750 [Chelatococcus sp. GCM10030263]|uniref:hypothetical protein n=1 Tax=Chelatococcus sp. GCM10030263 TaxID=3273387 RepID=UPI00360C1673